LRSLVWFRGKDLRVGDHAPLIEAAAAGEVIPLFVLGSAACASGLQRLLLLGALRELEGSLAALGSRLVVVGGPSAEAVPSLAERWQADRVLAHRCVEPEAREEGRAVERALGRSGIPLLLFEGETLVPPGSLRVSGEGLFRVFGAFARAFQREGHVGSPLAPPRQLPPLPQGLETETPWTRKPESSPWGSPPLVGEAHAQERLAAFLSGDLAGYRTSRDRLDLEGTSRLSADLHLGTVSVRGVWRGAAEGEPGEDARVFRTELLWREFAHHWLWERPELLERPFRAAFDGFPWQEDQDLWRAWTEGRTGYPLVDAAARQLLGEGFVHNRARMVAASFLAKDLLLDFRRGEAHYLAHLGDADAANNDLGWQWSAGCGCDAQPWFRIFNPTLQGARFDPEGDYVRRWVPELAHLPARWIHRPHQAPMGAGAYPRPIVDHGEARLRFLETAKAHLGR